MVPVSFQPVMFTLPYDPGRNPAKVLRNDMGDLAYWCRTLGTHSEVYIAPRVLMGSVGRTPVAAAESWAPALLKMLPAFVNAHPTDFIGSGGAMLGWLINGKRLSTRGKGTLTLVEDGPGRQVWLETRTANGHHVRTFYYCPSGSRQIGFTSLLTWSDSSSTAWSLPETIAIECPSYFVIDNLQEQGWFGEGKGTSPINADGKQTYIARLERLGDGQTVVARGTILPSPAIGEPQEALIGRFVAAATTFRAMASAADWAGKWFGSEPFVDTVPFTMDSFVAEMFGQRRAGLAKSSGNTGGSEEFGTYPALPQSALAFLRMELGATTPYRGIMHYEQDGSPLRAIDHPNWQTWCDRAQIASGWSPDRLGKQGDYISDTDYSGYTGFDWQHISQNMDLAYLALTGDYAWELVFKAHLECHAASVWWFWYEATRGLGRRLQNWVNADMLVPDERYRDLSQKICLQASQQSPSRNLPLDRPVRFLKLGDDYSIGVTDGSVGNYWENSICAAGGYRAWKRWNEPEMLWVAQESSRTAAAAFFMGSDNKLRTLNTSRFEAPYHVAGTKWPLTTLEGGPVTDAHVQTPADQGGWYAWYVAGLQVFLAVPQRDPSEVAERTDALRFLGLLKAFGVFLNPYNSRMALI